MDAEVISKEALRYEAVRHRDRIDPGSEEPEEACKLFFETLKPLPGQVVALYWPKGREFDCRILIERLLTAGGKCALPVVRKGTRELGFALWNESEKLSPSAFGVMEPIIDEDTQWRDPDIVVVPFLAFDRRGIRLGYGGGYYDATLRALRARKEIIAVGLGYAQQAVLFNLPREEHDELLDWVITPKKAHCF